ncbi:MULTISPECIES: helix-turn-helix domain-containing protein [Paenibacillus]|nr:MULTISPECIES: helix-turn-helix domain-containing protein [Paenibacillus]APB78085.2 hypothetical protein PPYC2_25560 [Paenibacillus polymyxa]POR26929.1 hypothetical protein CG775_16060 [Paenibacillus polymyxa]
MMNVAFHQLAFLSRLIYESIQLPVFYPVSNTDNSINVESSDDAKNSMYFSHQIEIARLLMEQSIHTRIPSIHKTIFDESYITIPFSAEEQTVSAIIIGPVYSYPRSAEENKNSYHEPDLDDKLQQYVQQLSHVNNKRLYHICILAFYLLNGVWLDISDVMSSDFLIVDENNSIRNKVDLIISKQRELSEYKDGRDLEERVLQIIRDGDKTKLLSMSFFSAASHFEEGGLLAKYSQLRNRKNLSICTITLACRAAVEGGLYAEIAYMISDHHIQHIEQLSDIKAVEYATFNALVDFVERVSKAKRKHLSKAISLCQEYINKHIYQNVNLTILADLTHLKPNYLSQKFKKETGITISNFIQMEKVEESKKLLLLTTDSIHSIALRLSFYDQTHFIKIFQKHTGATPGRYRRENKLR